MSHANPLGVASSNARPSCPSACVPSGGQSFAFLPHRFLRHGFFASLSPDERRLYVLRVLAADRNGLSFYHYDTICSLLEIPLASYLHTRNALLTKDLLAFDGTRFQVLSLPAQPRFDAARPQATDDYFEQDDPATIRHVIRGALDPPRRHQR